jgi:hypothetical protein
MCLSLAAQPTARRHIRKTQGEGKIEITLTFLALELFSKFIEI